MARPVRLARARAKPLSPYWDSDRVAYMLGSKTKSVRSTRFSDFIRNASSGEKKRVYRVVLEKASERQRNVLAMAKAREQGESGAQNNRS